MEWILIGLMAGGGWWGYRRLKGAEAPAYSATHKPKTAPPVRLPPSDFETVARESCWFVDPLPGWLVDAAWNHLNANDKGKRLSTVAIRNTGEQLTKDEKRMLGVRANAKLGQDYVDALSDKGKAENPLGAIELVLLRCMSRQARNRDLKRAVELGFPLKVEIMTAGDERDCECVQKYCGQPFALDEVPVLPLDRCDAAHCRCSYRIKPEI